MLLCYLWLDLVTPRFQSAGHEWYAINPAVMAVHMFVWGVILAICAIASNRVKKGEAEASHPGNGPLPSSMVANHILLRVKFVSVLLLVVTLTGILGRNMVLRDVI